MILAVVNAIYAIVYGEALKRTQDFNGIWTRDLSMPVRRSTPRSSYDMKPLLYMN